MRNCVAGFKFLMFFLLCGIIAPTQALILLVHQGRFARIMPYLWFNGVRKIFNIKLMVYGTPHTGTQTLYVANHMSYMDIPVIGSVLKTPFVSRADVANWPFFGYLAKLGQTAYVARARSSAKSDSSAINERIENGGSLIVFPEGTSTDGREVLPFKSSLFSLVIGHANPELHIQPFTLSLLEVDGQPPETQDERDIYTWHRNMDTELFPHLWRLAQHKGAILSLQFHPAIRANDYKDRKILAKTCYDTVSNGLGKYIAAQDAA